MAPYDAQIDKKNLFVLFISVINHVYQHCVKHFSLTIDIFIGVLYIFSIKIFFLLKLLSKTSTTSKTSKSSKVSKTSKTNKASKASKTSKKRKTRKMSKA